MHWTFLLLLHFLLLLVHSDNNLVDSPPSLLDLQLIHVARQHDLVLTHSDGFTGSEPICSTGKVNPERPVITASGL